jgi:hypothetical protein
MCGGASQQPNQEASFETHGRRAAFVDRVAPIRLNRCADSALSTRRGSY